MPTAAYPSMLTDASGGYPLMLTAANPSMLAHANSGCPGRLQGADLRCVPLPASCHPGGSDQRHAASRDPGDDQQVHDRPDPDPGQAVSLKPGRF